MASCYVQQGHFEPARVGYRAALAIDPGFHLAKKNLSIFKASIGGSFGRWYVGQ